LINKIKVYTENEDSLKQIISICSEYGFEMKNANEIYSTSIQMRLSSITTIMLILCIVITLITIFMLKYSTKMNILDSIYEIGVIKSLGASNLFVFGKFVTESAIQGIIAGLITAIIGVICAWSNILTYEGINIIDFEVYYWGIFASAGIIISVLSGLSDIQKVSRKQIVECLKRN